MPKKREDIDKIVHEVESTHEAGHEHGHEHHHHHGEVDEALSVMELLLDSLSVQVKQLEANSMRQARDLARLYRVVAYIVEALASQSDEERARALKKAIQELER